MSIEVQKAVQIGYTILQLHEAWHYEHTIVYDQTTGNGGLFANYMNTFIRLKMEAYGYPSGVETEQQQFEFIDKTERNDASKVKKNPGSRAVAKLCIKNLWGKLGQRPNMSQTKFIRHTRYFLI